MRILSTVLVFLFALILGSCSNSPETDNPFSTELADSKSNIDEKPQDEIEQDYFSSEHRISSSSEKAQSSSSTPASCSSIKDSLPLDDSEYPYAGIPRIVIETENHWAIKDRETEISAKLQVWGENTPESKIVPLTIRGRGNSSWTAMPKNSYKIEFSEKQTLLGMPKDKDWALIANYADKTLMKNYISYDLARKLGMYAPRCEFAELFVNGEYLGVYLVTETVKQGKNRVDIPESEFAYIVEFDEKYKTDEQVIFPKVISTNETGKPLNIHHPKNATQASLDTLLSHIEAFETYLETIDAGTSLEDIAKWLDIEAFIKHYWLQEFTKNPDSRYYTSIYFSWVLGQTINMGPAWDFDLAFGGYYDESRANPENWLIRSAYWNDYLRESKEFTQQLDAYYKDNQGTFLKINDAIDSVQSILEKPAKNNFKRWDILHEDGKWISKAIADYDEAVSNLKTWIETRSSWIEEQLATK